MQISHLDHLVLTVRSLEDTCQFYEQVLGMQVVSFGVGRTALHFGQQKINLHLVGHEFEPKAQQPTPGSADLCFITTASPDEVLQHLRDCGVAIVEGPVPKTGAQGAMTSVYVRDPDENLLEIASYD